jgi:hypothetical protein
MSEVAIQSEAAASESPFNPRTMLLVTAIGIVAFIAMLVLGAYAPDLRSGRNGGAHALSKAATGFSGLVRLADATGRHPMIVRSKDQLKSEDLTVITPDHGWADLGDILQRRGPRVTLVVLPKWESFPDQQKPGWVRISGLLPPTDPGRTLAPATPFGITREKTRREPLKTLAAAAPPELQFFAPSVLQTLSSKDVDPVIINERGAIVLGQLKGRQLYILADPDLLNNHGMADERQAHAALALLDFLNSTGAQAVQFDVTANGLGRSRSPLKLAFDAPFLAVTLTIFAAMLLAGWQALVRFGPVQQRARAIAFGKAALVDNSAALIRKAGREAQLGDRYVDVIRERSVALFRFPPAADPQTLNSRLESLNPNRSFAAAADAAGRATSRDELIAAAKSLNAWIKEVQQ